MEARNPILLLCKFNSKTTIIRLSNTINYGKLSDIVCGKWGISNISSLHMLFSIPGHDHCMLENDDDLENLRLIVSHLRIDNLGVSVAIDNCGNMNSGFIVPVGDHPLQIADKLFLNEDEVDLLSKYCPHKEKKNLLSDPWAYGISHIGLCFKGGIKEYRSVLCKYAIKRGFDFDFVKNEAKKVTVECVMREERGCLWRIHCSIQDGDELPYIKTMGNVHTCGSYIHHRRVSSDLVCECIIDRVRVTLGLGPCDIRNYMKSDYGIGITYRVAWTAVDKARCELFGDESTSFNDLRWYIDVASRNNPGSYFNLELDEGETRFRRLFFAFHACIYGFGFCRTLIFIDGTFLKGKYKGHLLSAVSKDGNNALFPIAFAIVDAENYENWCWFIENLKEIISDEHVYTVVSDRHKGLMQAVPDVWPECHHAFCLYHLKANLRDKLRGLKGEVKEAIISKFGDCAYAPTVESYSQRKESLMSHKCKKTIIGFLDKMDPKHWSNAYFEGRRYGEMTTNAAESLNAFVGEARNKPVMKIVDCIRYLVMEKLAESKKLSTAWNSIICPKMGAKLQEALEVGKTWVVRSANSVVFEVCSFPSNMVDIERCTCTCFQWQLNGFPCAHAAVAIQKSRRDVDDFVDYSFYVSNFRLMYSKPIYPVPSVGKQYWSCDDEFIHPPNSKTQPGRPKKTRIRSRGEKIIQMKCGRCDRYGHHNKKTCKGPLFGE